jgi:Fic family protein
MESGILKFLNGLDEDICNALIAQLRNLWTHGSTSLEGNTLTLGETAFVLEEGLTVSGKSLKDHQEVVGHARAIDLIYDMVENSEPLTEKDLFLLHKAVQTTDIFDVYKPVGAWKNEPNGTYMVDGDKQVFYEYATPPHVPALMKKWIDFLNAAQESIHSMEEAAAVYAKLHLWFVWIHPFFDGNGRMARLAANIPVLQAGFPPVMISKLKRREYILCLSGYELKEGPPSTPTDLLPVNNYLNMFISFCKSSWKESLDLVDTAHKKQRQRDLQNNSISTYKTPSSL